MRERKGELSERILTLLEERATPNFRRHSNDSSISSAWCIKTDGRVFFLRADEIEWIEARVTTFRFMSANGRICSGKKSARSKRNFTPADFVASIARPSSTSTASKSSNQCFAGSTSSPCATAKS